MANWLDLSERCKLEEFCEPLHELNEKTTKKYSIQPLLFYRYVDDCFAVFPNRVSALKFHHDLNTIHKDVKFTYELEHNKQLAFLDVSLDNSTGSIELSVHKKSTHTGL